MFKGSVWFLHPLIKTFLGNQASKVSSFSVQYSRYSNAVTTKLIHIQENTPYITTTICLMPTWPKNLSRINIGKLKKNLELRFLEVPLRKCQRNLLITFRICIFLLTAIFKLQFLQFSNDTIRESNCVKIAGLYGACIYIIKIFILETQRYRRYSFLKHLIPR